MNTAVSDTKGFFVRKPQLPSFCLHEDHDCFSNKSGILFSYSYFSKKTEYMDLAKYKSTDCINREKPKVNHQGEISFFCS